MQPKAFLQQGDLIRFHSPNVRIHKIGIVVTADCDLEKKKHANLVTLVPILSPILILENYILIDECERQKSVVGLKLRKFFEIGSSFDDVSFEGIIRGRRQEAQDELSEEILLAISFYLGELPEVSMSNYRSLMKFTGQNPKAPKALSQKISDKGDVLPLPSASGIGIEENIAWVRHIWQASAKDIALRTSEVSQKPGEKIARLASPFRYRLTQKLAQVFSDIGLPEIENNIENVVAEALK